MQINGIALLFIIFVIYTGVYSHWHTLSKSKRTAVGFISYIIYGTKKRQGIKFISILTTALTLAASGIGAWADPVLVAHAVWAVLIENAPFDPQSALNSLIILGGFHTAGYVIDSKAHSLGAINDQRG